MPVDHSDRDPVQGTPARSRRGMRCRLGDLRWHRAGAYSSAEKHAAPELARQTLETPASAPVVVAAAPSEEQKQYQDYEQDREHDGLVSVGLADETTGSAGPHQLHASAVP